MLILCLIVTFLVVHWMRRRRAQLESGKVEHEGGLTIWGRTWATKKDVDVERDSTSGQNSFSMDPIVPKAPSPTLQTFHVRLNGGAEIPWKDPSHLGLGWRER